LTKGLDVSRVSNKEIAQIEQVTNLIRGSFLMRFKIRVEVACKVVVPGG
jgi:hypothetical protein